MVNKASDGAHTISQFLGMINIFVSYFASLGLFLGSASSCSYYYSMSIPNSILSSSNSLTASRTVITLEHKGVSLCV